MIVPMLRLTLLCSARDRLAALSALRELGSVHVSLEVRDGEAIRAAASAVSSAEQALRVLDVAEKNGVFAFKPEASSPINGMNFTQLSETAEALQAPTSGAEINRAAEVVTRLREEAMALQLQLRRYEPFGSVDPATIAALSANGLPVTLFKVPQKEAETLEHAFCFATTAGFTYGAWISEEPLPGVCEAIPTPEISTQEMYARWTLAEGLANKIVRLLAGSTYLRDLLKADVHARSAEKVAAEVATNLRDAGDVAYLLGYIPERQAEALTARAQREGWGIVLETPEEGDPNVPVLMEPPKGFRSIGVLFKGLGILPGYSEGDCSVPFYVFFSIFFAMLVGDAGYGLIMLSGVILAALKLRKVEAARPALLIFTVFCLSTIAWGILSGTYFGIAKDALPAFLRDIPTVAWLGDDNNLMFLCFLIGAVHISLARIWNAVLLAPHLKMLGEVGWLGVTWSMFCIVSGIVVSWFTSPDWTWYLLGGSVLFILIPLVADIKHEGVSIGMLPLNVISAMGDIISYVRLFAVGLASVKVAENFNAMALSLDLPLVVKVLAVCAILLVGHGLNLAMGALSVLVHAVRLNTLEFSNAKGITWSGMPYTPFKQP